MMDKNDLFLPGTFETETLISWAKSLDPEMEYKYTDVEFCFLGRYFNSRLKNKDHVSWVGTDFGFVENENRSLIGRFEIDTLWDKCSNYPVEKVGYGVTPLRKVKGFLEAYEAANV